MATENEGVVGVKCLKNELGVGGCKRYQAEVEEIHGEAPKRGKRMGW